MQPPLNPISEIERKVDDFYHFVIFGKKLSPELYYLPLKFEENDIAKIPVYMNGMKELFSSLPEEEILPALDYYIRQLNATDDLRKCKVLVYLIEYGVLDNFLNAQFICEKFMKSEFLTFDNEKFWCLSFKLVNKIISRVDYKGVRDLLKCILEKASEIIFSNNISAMDQFRAVEAVLQTIFDRNNSLLPSYLIMDELQKKNVLKTTYPHWKLCTLTRHFVNSFRIVAQMVTVSILLEIKVEESNYEKSKLLPIVGHPATMGTIPKVDCTSGMVTFKDPLPYNKELSESQTSLLKYLLEQPYSREMVCSMLGLSKQAKFRSVVLEKQLIELIVSAMEKSESETDSLKDDSTQLFWQNLSSQLIYFVLFQFASFPEIVNGLTKELKARKLQKGRDHLMWVLLQFISGSIQKNDIRDFYPVMVLHDLLYTEKEPLSVPDIANPNCTHTFAMISIYINLMHKAHCHRTAFKRSLPVALSSHFEYLQSSLSDTNLSQNVYADYRIPLLCNAYSTNQELFVRPIAVLTQTFQGNETSSSSLSEVIVSGHMKPLPMSILDSLTVHTKMSLIHNIASHVMKLAQSKSALYNAVLSPALVETYCRLLVYSEIESLGIKNIISHLLPIVFRSHSWGILHTLLEIFSYRLHHIQPHYRVQLLNHLHSLAAVPQTNQTQLHLCVESTALKLISGMSSSEVQSLLPRSFAEQKALLSNESEELNKVLVLTIARAIHVTGSESLLGSWNKEILTNIMHNTPLSWSSLSLNCFPSVLADFFTMHQIPNEIKIQLKHSVEEEYRKWKTMSNENDIISHFSLQSSSPLFLCLLWKMLLDNDRISTIAYEILDRIGSRALSAHLRTFCDFLVFEFANSDARNLVNKYIDALNDLIWKCDVIQLDRFILCMVLRNFKTINEAQVCLFIIYLLLLRPSEFKSRVYDFVKENSPEHWKQSDWHEKHLLFHRTYKEKFYFEGLHSMNAQKREHSYLPVYFGNVCLRFLTVLDIVIHRFIELPTVRMPVESLLDQLGCLYKFHDRPLTYLYNTLYYYEQNLKDKHLLKKKLISAIVGSLKDIRPSNWALSDNYIQYLQGNSEDLNWVPDDEYYVKLIGRLVDTINGKSPFPHTDWRFNEFPNQGAHALHVTCIELMSLPISFVTAANNFLDIILRKQTLVIHDNIVQWMNAVALVLTALPQTFMSVLNDRILEELGSHFLTNTPVDMDAFLMFDFAARYNSQTALPCSFLIGLVHSVWYHASIGQLCGLIKVLKEKFKPAVKTEVQFIFMCHLFVPFLQRFYNEGFQYITAVTIELYEMLETVNKNCNRLVYTDPICDLLYHIKYMFVGNSINNEIARIIKNLNPEIQRKLKFIIYLNMNENRAT